MANRRRITLEVSELQETVIKGLFDHFGWDYQATIHIDQGQIGNTLQHHQYIAHANLIPQNPEEPECPHCLCRPCITTNHQGWFRLDPARPHILNSRRRKTCYKKFWSMLLHRGVWVDARYLMRKGAALNLDPRYRNFVYHRRDIMPDCVVKNVRNWYPNPGSIPYMGHMWE